MPINNLYHTWFQRIRDLRPDQRITLVRNFVWLIIGIYQSHSVCLSRVSGKIHSPAKLLSATRRLSRLLDNPAIRVREWYEPIAREWLDEQFRHLGKISLIMDGNKNGFRHQLLIVCLAYRKRAVPIAWAWVKHVKRHSTARKQLALLAYARQLILQGAAVFLVGDCEFGSVRSCASWINGFGSTFCGRKPMQASGSMKKAIGNPSVVTSRSLVRVSGWEAAI